MKSIKVPFISGLDKMGHDELLAAMETRAERGYIDNANWPAEYPYKPIAVFDVARSEKHLFISYFVRGLDLKAVYAKHNDPVWQDSCVEFFVKEPQAKHYFNFEFNCIGTCLASKRSNSQDVASLDPVEIEKIIRVTSLEKAPFDERKGVFQWQEAVGIPFELFGVDPDALPAKLRANFFKCADGTEHIHYLSWSPIDFPKPNFHLPEFFGELLLE